MTHLARVSEARHLELHRLSMTVTPTFVRTGSIREDTAAAALQDVRLALTIESDAAREAIAALVATAERMCYMLDAIEQPHPVYRTVTLNGEALVG